MRLPDKTALVTGSTSNIGRAIALAFAREGAQVVVSGRDASRGAEVVAEIRAGGGRADFVAADLDGSPERSRELAAAATEALGGRVDILVNNAGIFPPSTTLTTDEETFDRVYAVNVKAPFFLTAAIVPAMVARGDGAIINLGSWIARLGIPVSALYSSTKGAIETLTRAWAAEFGPTGVRVNAISPGVTRAPTPDGSARNDRAEAMMRGTPTGRSGTPDAIAHAAVYLAGDEAAFVHGTVLDVDRGRDRRWDGRLVSSLVDPLNIADYERLATAALDPGPLAYYAGAAGDERTLRANEAAWADYALCPRVLVDVSEVSTATTVVGTEISMPIIVAPVALQRMAHPDGELAMARGAADANTLMTLSTIATATPREVADAVPDAPRWFQVYVMSDRGVTRHLVDQAIDAGYRALVVTVDAPIPGKRERDLRVGFAVPPGIDVPAVTAARRGAVEEITVANLLGLVDPSLTWDGLAALMAEWSLPVILKGVQTAADARRACELGVAGLVVSNHGGRQLDTVAATAHMLPEIVEAVDGRLEVLVDGGIRRGTDVAAALALGARAVLVGRPALYALTVGGADGVRRALAILRAELRTSMTLLGCPTVADIGAEHVAPAR
jgi:isopentenyl diphosphate isomerase/L-lactate dehydrogenase-like FMN-dependent dehydrogenase/NAD(P)-dependent dehydrogenase (short-subunit alcohol dehydrogenase family)